MLNHIYNALWYPAVPLIRRYLQKRARKAPAYAKYWDERFGKPHQNPVQGAIWIHAVSVGETRAAYPLVVALQKRFPNLPLLLTQMTPTGRATAQGLFPNAQCRYLPYDRSKWVKQFLMEHRPRFGVLMETEIWPNLMAACRQNEVPLFLANARLSERSWQSYRRIDGLIRPVLGHLAGCYAQTSADGERLLQLGVSEFEVCGNTKYDITPPAEAAQLGMAFRHLIGTRRVFLAASTRHLGDEDEAEIILQAWKQHGCKDALLVLVPRHPERFQMAFDAAVSLGLQTQKRSDNQMVHADTRVWIGDSMGELFAYYHAADVAFVGGSLVDTGCQNIIEPLSCGKPVLFGPSIYNFQSVCEGALVAGAAKQVDHATELVKTVRQWFARPEKYADFHEHAAVFVQQHQGASEKIAGLIADVLKHDASLSK